MIQSTSTKEKRENKTVEISAGFIVVGGGMAGTCAAITAARKGVKVVLVQDRPVLGGNSSSEVRLWILGATSHMGNNNRWAREGGVIDEILVENMFRNKEGNTIVFDTVVLEKVTSEPNITLLLNTAVFDLEKSDGENITSVKAFCSQNSTEYVLKAPLFCDASGDGIVGFKAGASFRMGAENGDEFGELFTPTEDYGELLGHTIYFHSKDVGKPVKYVAPAYALKDINKIPRFRNINTGEHGCKFWWFEYGGRRDTVHETEEIKWELWSVVFGVWDYIKNSGNFPDAENLTLEWVGTIPGKRESRRFEGHYMLKQQDIVEQAHFYDAVAFGGWAIDLHPADGVFSKLPGCNQYHSKGIYEIPYRCYISKDIKNLFFAGRLISASHVAFGTTRVMATGGLGGQVVGMAAALCLESGLHPENYIDEQKITILQQALNLMGQSIPGIPADAAENLAATANIEVSGQLLLNQIPFNGQWLSLESSAAQLLPLRKDTAYSFELLFDAASPTTLDVELQTSSKLQNYTPDVCVEKQIVALGKGKQKITIPFNNYLQKDQYAFLIFRKNPLVKIRCSQQRMTGILSVFNKTNPAVNNYGKQIPPENSGFESFEFWCPERRPKGENIAMNISPALDCFSAQNLVNGFTRPYIQPNAWVADIEDTGPVITLSWDKMQIIKSLRLFLDTDYDHPMESSQFGHPEDVMPFVVREFSVYNEKEELLYDVKNNHQTIVNLFDGEEKHCQKLIIKLKRAHEHVPVSIFQIQINNNFQ